MARLRHVKRGGKHARRRFDDDLTLESKRVSTKKPTSWEEDEDGELQPVFVPDEPDLMFSREQLEPYRSMPSLFMRKERMRKLVGSPFPFLDLPKELRLEIYSYCLVAHTPIGRVVSWNNNSLSFFPKLAVNLLGVCKAMRDECAKVFYGENEFRFASHYGHLHLLRFLNRIGPSNRRWLRTLSMTPPFLQRLDRMHKCEEYLKVVPGLGRAGPRFIGVYNAVCPQFSRHSGYQLERITWASLSELLLNLLESLSQLRELTIVLPDDWKYPNDNVMSTAFGRKKDFEDRQHVWGHLAAFLRSKPFLPVRVVQLLEEGELYEPDRDSIHDNQERYVATLRRRLGIWDRRFAFYDESGAWDMPEQVEEGPDEPLLDVRTLFG